MPILRSYEFVIWIVLCHSYGFLFQVTVNSRPKFPFFIAHLVTEAITQAVIAETIIYGRKETEFVEGERPNFDAGLN